jgi:hypothetical protein
MEIAMIMKKKHIKLVIVLISTAFIYLSCNTSKTLQGLPMNFEESLRHNQVLWLKDYAVCKCLYYGYEKDSVIKKDISTGILASIADHAPYVYETIDSISLQIANSIKPYKISEYGNKKAVLLHCMEFYRSKKLDSIINKFK